MKISKHFVRFNEFAILYRRGNLVCVDPWLKEVPKTVDVYLWAHWDKITRFGFYECSYAFHRSRQDNYFIRGLNYIIPTISEDY